MNNIKIKVDADDNLRHKEIHFFNLFDIQYQQDTSIIDFYNQYRNFVISKLKKKGDTIMWLDNMVLAEDETISPTFEELIMAVVLGLIDYRLPGHVRDNYFHLLGKAKSLMDYRMDILAEVPTFLRKINGNLQAVSKCEDDPLALRYGNGMSYIKLENCCLLFSSIFQSYH
jgi:hypothetical protein